VNDRIGVVGADSKKKCAMNYWAVEARMRSARGNFMQLVRANGHLNRCTPNSRLHTEEANMLSDYASSWKSQKNQMPAGEMQTGRLATRRTAHGGTAWGARPECELRQPQDGGFELEVRSRVAEITAHLSRNGFVEPEDARLTGTTRSLMRRLMGLNVLSRKAQRAAAPLRSLLVRKQPQVA
jgi:hypothetical protein